MNILDNREQLRTNNTTLAEQVLSMVRDLPEAGGGGEDVTAETNEYTSLLSEALTEIEGKAALGGDATAEDIREGKTAYVNGQLLQGLMSEGLTAETFCHTKMAVDKFTFTSNTTYNNAISHSLGEKPAVAIIVSPEEYPTEYNSVYRIWSMAIDGSTFYVQGGQKGSNDWTTYKRSRGADTSASEYAIMDANTIKINLATDYSYYKGVEYTLITMA